MRFGEGLRSERERRGIALDDISVATRVSLRNLRALESEEFQHLPGGIFNRGIIRSYARYCGMDEDQTVNAYTEALRQRGMDPAHENEDWATFAENVRRNRTTTYSRNGMRWAGVAAMVLGLVVVACAVVVVLVRRNLLYLPPRLEFALHLRHGAPRHAGTPDRSRDLAQ